jgi:predicted ribosomally synthesized peptide with nif11-like leader
MSQQELERFVMDVKTNGHLQVQIIKAANDPETVTEFAQKNGYDFTVEELNAYAEKAKGKLSEEQLDRVAGGHFIHSMHHDWDKFKHGVEWDYKSPDTVQVIGVAGEVAAAVVVVVAT